MKIAFLTLEYPPAGGGIASSLATIAPALARRGHQVRIVGWSDSGRSERDRGVVVEFEERTRWPKIGWWINPRRVERRLRRLVTSSALDVLVAHDWCGPSALVDPGCPVAVWCHGSATYFGDLTGEAVRKRLIKAEQRALDRARSVAAVSAFTARETQRLFSLDRVPLVVHNSVDVNRFVPAKVQEVNRNRLLYCGTVVRKKGVLELCEAFNRVVAEEPSARLVVVGRDSRDAQTGHHSTWELCRALLSSEARERVEYRGFIPYQQIDELIRTCLAAVLPSRAEALPLAWMEVMACARPVVALAVGWAPELIVSGQDGVLVPCGDIEALAGAMVQLLRDPVRADRLGAAARSSMSERFSEEVIVAGFERWMQEAIG